MSEIPDHGRFRLELEYNTEYLLIFNQKGYLEKKIIVNTEVPSEILDNESNLPRFLMGVKLYQENQDPANLYFGNQTEQISYSRLQNCFSRVPTVYEAGYVEKEITKQARATQIEADKSKIQVYQTF
ncbi:MAG: hypothetical protein WC384_22490 [Prolixibacteraceae bacterium]